MLGAVSGQCSSRHVLALLILKSGVNVLLYQLVFVIVMKLKKLVKVKALRIAEELTEECKREHLKSVIRK